MITELNQMNSERVNEDYCLLCDRLLPYDCECDDRLKVFFVAPAAGGGNE